MEQFIKGNNPEIGSLLKIKRKYGYYHYGIYIGNNKVIHFSGDNTDSVNNSHLVSIRKDNLENFIRGDNLEYLSPNNSPYSVKELIHRAETYVGSKTFFDKPYNFVSNNCEHFARYVFYGERDCTQVKTLARILAIAAALGTTAGITINQINKHNKLAKDNADNEK